MSHTKYLYIAVLLVFGIFFVVDRSKAAEPIKATPSTIEKAPVTCEVLPDEVFIDSFYHGAKLKITGKSDINDEIIIKISSPPTESSLKFMGKAAGLFWMKIGDMEFKPVSNVYMLYTTGAIDKIASPEERIRSLVGYDAIKAQLDITSSKGPVDKDRWFNEFIKFKEKDKVYGIYEGTIVKDGKGGFSATVDWPYQASPGEYKVIVFAIRDGRAYAEASQKLVVRTSGMITLLSDLAFKNPAIYGVVAIVIAMLAGLGVGIVFKGGGGH